MAFDRIIVAIGQRAGVYSVTASEFFNSNNDIDWPALEAFRAFADVSGTTGYVDQAIVLSPEQLQRFVRSDKARQFVANADAAFFVVHRAEWESGLD
jgi:hypothetical protein